MADRLSPEIKNPGNSREIREALSRGNMFFNDIVLVASGLQREEFLELYKGQKVGKVGIPGFG